MKFGESPRAVAVEHLAPLAAAVAFTLMFVHVLWRRLGYPHELEWMTGSILDHIERVRTGQPLYTAPTVDWIPFMYPPLYYWVAALATEVVPGILGPRLVSLASTLVQAYCVWRLALRHGATRSWAVIGVGLFFAAFSYTGFWYDLERSDALFVALMAAGATILCESAGLAGASIAGTILGIGFFAKQPAALFVGAGAVALLLGRERGRAAAFGGAAATIMAAGTAWLHVTTDGWFTYYVIRMPFVHGMHSEYVTSFFVQDLTRGFTLTIATAAFAIGLARDRRKDTVFACMLVAGFLASATSRLHPGGWDNVLLFWTPFAIAGVAIVCTRADEALRDRWLARAAVAALVTVQFGLWSYDVHAMHSREWQQKLVDEFEDRVHALEASDGEVLVTGSGHVTTPRHFHMAALVDVVRADGRLPEAIARSLSEHRFADIVIGTAAELQMPQLPAFDQQLFRLVAAHYYVAERLPDRPPPVVGFAARSLYVLRPRTRVLDPADLVLLMRRHQLEVVVAENRMQMKAAKVAPRADEANIEDMARDLAGRSMIGDVTLSGVAPAGR